MRQRWGVGILGFVAVFLSECVAAQEATSTGGSGITAVELDGITVSAAKSVRRIDEVPATVTTIDAEDLQRELIENIGDLVRYEPGVSVPSSAP